MQRNIILHTLLETTSMKKLLSLLLIMCFFQYDSFSQEGMSIDSLELALKRHYIKKKEFRIKSPTLYDTNAVNILNRLCRAQRGRDPEKSMDFANQALALSQQIGYKKGECNAYQGMGNICNKRGDYLASLDLYKKALLIRLELGNKKDIAGSYNDIGITYYDQGNYPEALKNYLSALKIKEEVGDKEGIANSYGNIGNIYSEQGNYPEALKNYFTALKKYLEMGIKEGVANTYLNIGITYAEQGNYPEALKKQFAAFEIQKELGDKAGIADSYFYIGGSYGKQGNYDDALMNLFAALKIQEEIGDKKSIAFSLVDIGDIYSKQNKYNDASGSYNRALALSKEIGSLELIVACYNGYAKLDSAKGDYNKALENYKLYIIYRDSIENTENARKIVALQMNYDFNKKQDSLNVVQAKKDLIAQKELNKQILVRNRFIGGSILLLILSGAAILFFIDRSKRNRKKQMEAVRARISRDLHDDMGSTLQSISVMSEVARMKSASGGSHESIPFLEKIGSASREMVDKMNDIVWAVSPQNDNFENIILHMRAFGGELLSGKNIALDFKSDSGLNNIMLSMEKRKSFFLIYKEALNNAYKYSGAKNVTVEITKTNHLLTLIVKDDGIGFNMNENRLKTGGNGLKNMHARAAELNGTLSMTSAPGQGTMLRLTVNLSLK
jgi:signal transduction histidine kinase/TolA-binding protein